MFLLLVNFLLTISVISGLAAVSTEKPILGMYSTILSTLSFVSAFIVAAIGLAADLGRMTSKNKEKK